VEAFRRWDSCGALFALSIVAGAATKTFHVERRSRIDDDDEGTIAIALAGFIAIIVIEQRELKCGGFGESGLEGG